jgi:hypothetical protein
LNILSLVLFPDQTVALEDQIGVFLNSQLIRPDRIIINIPIQENLEHFAVDLLPRNDNILTHRCDNYGNLTSLIGLLEFDEIHDEDTIVALDIGSKCDAQTYQYFIESLDILNRPDTTLLGSLGINFMSPPSGIVRCEKNLSEADMLLSRGGYAIKGKALNLLKDLEGPCLTDINEASLSTLAKKANITIRSIQNNLIHHKKNFHDLVMGQLSSLIRAGVGISLPFGLKKHAVLCSFLNDNPDFDPSEAELILSSTSLEEGVELLDKTLKSKKEVELCNKKLKGGINKNNIKDYSNFAAKHGLSKLILRLQDGRQSKGRKNLRRKAAIILDTPDTIGDEDFKAIALDVCKVFDEVHMFLSNAPDLGEKDLETIKSLGVQVLDVFHENPSEDWGDRLSKKDKLESFKAAITFAKNLPEGIFSNDCSCLSPLPNDTLLCSSLGEIDTSLVTLAEHLEIIKEL